MSCRTILVRSSVVLAVLLALSGSLAIAAQRVRPVATQRKLEVSLADDAVIRFKKAPKLFDDKGKPVTPTADQLQAMKGDPKLPGYAAELSDLKAGQIVKVSLGRRKMPKGEKTTEAGTEKKPDKPTWASLGDITVRLLRVEGVDPPKGKGKKNAERKRDVEPKLILGIDAVTLARVGRKASGTKITLGEDVFATKVMILSDSETEK
jgi:hypothetical protein